MSAELSTILTEIIFWICILALLPMLKKVLLVLALRVKYALNPVSNMVVRYKDEQGETLIIDVDLTSETELTKQVRDLLVQHHSTKAKAGGNHV